MSETKPTVGRSVYYTQFCDIDRKMKTWPAVVTVVYPGNVVDLQVFFQKYIRVRLDTPYSKTLKNKYWTWPAEVNYETYPEA